MGSLSRRGLRSSASFGTRGSQVQILPLRPAFFTIEAVTGNDTGNETVAQRKHFAPIDRCRSRRLHSNVENFNSIAMSALPPKADIGTQSWNVRFVPKAEVAVGPALNGLDGRKAGTVEGYDYSKGKQELGDPVERSDVQGVPDRSISQDPRNEDDFL